MYNHERRMSAANARQNPTYGMMSTELMTTAGAAAAAAAERPQTLELPLTPRTPLRYEMNEFTADIPPLQLVFAT